MAATLRRELQIDVDSLHGPYGQYKVLVDDEVVVDGGLRATLGFLPSGRRILEAVRLRLALSERKTDGTPPITTGSGGGPG